MSFDPIIDVRLTSALDDGRPIWELLASLSYNNVVVPIGSKTDGASIPVPISWFIPTINYRTFPACVLHDYLVDAYRLARYRSLTYVLTRKQIDKLFWQALRDHGVNHVLAYVMYLGVRFDALQNGEK